MEKEQIVKALGCCSNDECANLECPYYSLKTTVCIEDLHKDALSLIREQENRIEELTLEYAGFEAGAKAVARFIQADTVQKYREKLHREFASLGSKDKFKKEFFLTKVDKIANKLLEENA